MKNKKKIKSLIVGLGKVGMLYDINQNEYKTHSSSIMSNNNFELLGGVDTDISKRKIFKKKYKKPAYAYLKNAIYKLKPQLLIISVPTSNTSNIYKIIIRNNFKFRMIFLEKPINYKINIIEEFLSYCFKKKIRIAVNYSRRYDESSLKLKNLIKKRKLGKCKNIKVDYKKGFYNSCSHYINYLEFLFGKKIVIVQSKLIGKLGNDYKINFDLFIKPAINVIFRFNKNIYSNEKILIHFTNGKIEYLTEKGQLAIKSNNKTLYLKNNYSFPLKNVYENISYVFFGKIDKAKSSYLDALYTSKTLNDILLKAR